MKAGDFDADGQVDVVASSSNRGSVGQVAWFRNLGAGLFSSPAILSDWSAVGAYPVDVDGDGSLDVVWSGWDGLNWRRNLGYGDFAPAQEPRVGSALNPLSFGDIDGDGSTDIVTFYDRTVLSLSEQR